MRDVLQREPRPLAVGGEAQRDPARRAAELPRQVERIGPLAARDGAASVALELVATAQLQIAFDGEKPADQARGRRDRVPEIVDRRGIGAGGDDDERGLAQVLAVFHPTGFGAEHVLHVRPPPYQEGLHISAVANISNGVFTMRPPSPSPTGLARRPRARAAPRWWPPAQGCSPSPRDARACGRR